MWRQLGKDGRQGGVATFLAVLSVGAVEFLGGLLPAIEHPFRFAAICLAITTSSAAVIAMVLSACFLLPRAIFALVAGRAAATRWPGLFAKAHNPSTPDRDGIWVHAVGVGLSVFVLGTTFTIHQIFAHFTHLALASLICAIAAIIWIGTGALMALVTMAVLRAGSDRLTSGRPTPYSGPTPAILIWVALAWLFVIGTTTRWEDFALVFPYRLALSATVFVFVLLLAYMKAALLFELACKRARLTATIIGAVATLSLVVLFFLGGSDDSRRIALRSPTLTVLFDIMRTSSDWDRDGYTSLLNGGDCRPFDASFHPGARDIPHDGLDQNCQGGDYVRPPARTINTERLPPALAKDDWSILLVTIDTLRYDHVGFTGYERATTPRLDAIASRGAFFRNAYSPGNRTYFVIPSLVSSLPHERLPLGERLGPGLPRALGGEITTLAEVLAEAGYRTGLFTSHTYFEGWGVEQGFQQVVNLPKAVSRSQPAAHRLVDQTIRWLEDAPDAARWFAWIHFYEPHHPYESHGYGYGKRSIDRYDEEIRYVDSQLARLMDWIESDVKRRDRTIVVITSDHGEGFGEHGTVRHGGDKMWEVLIHIPLIISVPGAAPRLVNTSASLIDLAPTLAELTGTPPPIAWTGRSQVKEIIDGSNDDDVVVFASDPDSRNHAAITTNWKLTYDERHNVYQLINLSTDSNEQYDASRSHPEVRARLETALNDWREQTLD